MGRPTKRAGAVQTPERLLDAAELEFAAAGFVAARLEDIARRAGIRRPSLLHHFATKEALYAAVVQRSFAALGAALGGAMGGGGGFPARLDALVGAFAAFLEQRPALAPVIVRELLDRRGPGRVILLRQVAPLVGHVERFLRRAGRAHLRPRLPLRAALMQTCADLLLRSAAGDLRTPLWGRGDHARALARLLFLADGAPAEAAA